MKYLLFSLFIMSIIVTAQNDSVKVETERKYSIPPPPPSIEKEVSRKQFVSAREVEIMAIYPGCDRDWEYRRAKDNLAKKRVLINCMARSLQGEIGNNLNVTELEQIARKNKIQTIRTKLDFIVNTDGKIVKINNTKGNSDFGARVKKILERLSVKLESEGGIEPAKYEDGEKVNLRFAIPIRFVCEDCHLPEVDIESQNK